VPTLLLWLDICSGGGGHAVPLRKALGCSGSPTSSRCRGEPGSAQALGALLKGLRRALWWVPKVDLPKLCRGTQACFTLSDGEWDCFICYLCCSVCLGWVSLPSSHPEHLPLRFPPSPLPHPAGILPRGTGLPPPSFSVIPLLQPGVVLSISLAKHKAALSPIHSSGPGFALQLTIVPLICALAVGFAVNARRRSSAGLTRLWK